MTVVKMKRGSKAALVVFAVMLSLAVAFCAFYVSDYYRAEEKAIAAFSPASGISENAAEPGKLVFMPENAKTAMIFYPGGKVEYTSYIPLMRLCAERGIMCVLLEMPFNLAVFDMSAAEDVRYSYPEIESWYIGGHSLGGSMAAAYLEESFSDYEGLILLGSYSTADLSETDLEVLSLYGSEDKVLNREKYEQSRINLPDSFTELEIEGGCHAYFGSYGLQEGDGNPTISNEEQLIFTAEKIAEFVKPSQS